MFPKFGITLHSVLHYLTISCIFHSSSKQAPPITSNATTTKVLDAPLGKINIHFRGGYIIPPLFPATTTTVTRQSPFHLLIALDESGSAKGNLYWDDGDTIGMLN